MEYKKIIHSICIVAFLAQAHTTSVVAYRNTSCLAVPSIFREARRVVHNNDYQLLKINEAYYIYLDTSGNVIHIHTTREGWQAEHNGRHCTLTLDGHTPAPGDIVVYLLKKDYRIEEIVDTVIHLSPREKHPIARDEAIPPEEIIVTEFRNVLGEFRGTGLTEVSEFERIITRVLEVSAGIRKDTILYSKESEFVNAIKPSLKPLSSRIAKFLCSSTLEMRLVGERLKDTIDMLGEKEGTLRIMASSMQTELDRSELLLQKCLIEQIIMPMFNSELKSVEDFFSTTFVEDEGRTVWKLTLHGRVVTECEFYRKTEGILFGIIMIMHYRKGEREYSKKYFVKGPRLYQIFNTPASRTGITVGKISLPDLKEFVVYKMLEKLGLGAKIHFVTNPYARSGLFIVSEDVADSTRGRFIKVAKLEELLQFEETSQLEKAAQSREELGLEKDIVVSALLAEELEGKHISLLKLAVNWIDLLGRIFNLSDFNSGNFGVVGKGIPTRLPWKMIDFEVVDSELPFSLKGFLEGNSQFHYAEPGILAAVLKRRDQEEKIRTGMEVMEDLRKTHMFERHLEETCNEIIKYLQTVIPAQGITVAEVLRVNVTAERQKLERYKGYVMRNFRGLYDELETEYVKSMHALLATGDFGLSIDTSQTRTSALREIVFDEGRKTFTIPRDVVVSAGMIVTLLGGDYLGRIVTAIREHTMRSSKISDTPLLSQWMEKLDTLEGVDDVEKIMGLFGILRVIGRDEFIMPDLEIINFESMRQVITAA